MFIYEITNQKPTSYHPFTIPDPNDSEEVKNEDDSDAMDLED